MYRQLLSGAALLALCLMAMGCHTCGSGMTKCGMAPKCAPACSVQKAPCQKGVCQKPQIQKCSTPVCIQKPTCVQKTGCVQKCGCRQILDCSSCIQPRACCQKGPCLQKGGCCQKPVCQKGGICSKGGKCGLLCHSQKYFWSGCGCGEKYYGPWISDPPACCDPCDGCGNWVGPRGCCKKIFDPWLAILSCKGLHCRGCSSSCCKSCKTSKCGKGAVIEGPGMIIEDKQIEGDNLLPPLPEPEIVPSASVVPVQQASAELPVRRAAHHTSQLRR